MFEAISTVIKLFLTQIYNFSIEIIPTRSSTKCLPVNGGRFCLKINATISISLYKFELDLDFGTTLGEVEITPP